MLTSPVFQADQLQSSTEVLRALAHPLRLDLIHFIRRSGWVSVQTIYQSLGIEQSLTSQHLRILRRAGLVVTERDGKHVNYHLVEERYDQVADGLARFFETAAVA